MSKVVIGKIFESEGLAWNIYKSDFLRDADKDWISSPLCPTRKCRVILDFTGGKREVVCFNCGKKSIINRDIAQVTNDVNQRYQASKQWDAEVINLDLLPTKVSSEDEDENYKIIAKLGQKNGKRTAVVYILDRIEQKGEKAQFFIDVDDEMIRFDKDDKHPLKLLAKVDAEFLESKHSINKKPRSK